MVPDAPRIIQLRRTRPEDLELLHGFELDDTSNALAGPKPRDWPTFLERWRVILADPDGSATGVTPRVIEADGLVVGSINISPHQGVDSIGYWIDRLHWGRGIATRAVGCMLSEFCRRPLFATTSGTNLAPIRVLVKNGFELLDREMTAETLRTVQRETVRFVLRHRVS